MAFPEIGKPAPVFSAPDQNGEMVSLGQFKDKIVVLYFYPKAMTPGCTVQACGLRDAKADLEAAGIVTLGVSIDESKRLKKFEERDSLNFTLLSDPEHELADKYGAWGPKKFMGKEYDGILRTTFIIDKSGNLAHIISKVKTKTHDQDVLTWVSENL